MGAVLVAFFALSLAAQPLLLSESLQVVTADSALGSEIARAARRYVHGTVQVRSVSQVDSMALRSGSEAALTVQQEPASSTGQRWILVLSSGPHRTVRRTLELHEIPSRFDLAEAIAIGLPDMLARLAEQSPPPAHAAGRLISPAAPATHPTHPVVAMLPRVPSSPSLPSSPAPGPEPTSPPNAPPLKPEGPPETPPLKEGTPPAHAPVDATETALPAKPPTAQPAARDAQPTPHPQPPPLAPAPMNDPPVAEPARTPQPSGALALLGGGAVVALAGIGTGAAAIQTARKVDQPTQQHFDRSLDERGKALDTATIVLDCVGAAAMLGGGTWLLVRAVKARRETPKIALRPMGLGAVLRGSF